MNLHFLKPGLQTTIQDRGRFGYEAFGVPRSGALDKIAYNQANYLVDNPEGSPVFEITLTGPQIVFDSNCQIALTGADMGASVNGIEVPICETVNLGMGSTLVFKGVAKGCRAYLAIRGQWQVRQWLGSCSKATINPEVLTPDSLVEKGNKLKIIPVKPIKPRKVERPGIFSSGAETVGILPGPEFEQFSHKFIAQFFSTEFSISADSNRMGLRLGQPISLGKTSSEIISSGVVPGTIQITNSGQPIILLADAQTTGGYNRIANVCADDLNRLAQKKPGDLIRFKLC
ncbi:MAG: biotin-dependent carboxyltransferase family protein [Cyclobacteriaceae bacterium]